MRPRHVDGASPSSGGAAGRSGEELHRLLERLSLSGSEARTLSALLVLGTATMNQLAQATGISRPNLYPVLESLQVRGLSERLPGRHAVWSSPRPAEVLAVLEADEAARVAAAGEAFGRRLEEARDALAALPTPAERAASAITVIDVARSIVIYEETIGTVDSEVLVFNRGPYAGDVEPSEGVLEALARGVRARALYQDVELDDTRLRHCADVYGRAGVEQRVVEALPVSMAVLGHALVLLTPPSDVLGTAGQPPVGEQTAVLRGEAMVELMTAAFEHFWVRGEPYTPSGAGCERSARS